MEITCSICNRVFDVDKSRVEGLTAARCLCGERLPLSTKTGEADAPQRFGKYVLSRRIAMGGMGEVFYGKIAGVEGFEREVAIKRMLPHLSEDRSFIDMMVKEAKLTVLLRHPNIVQVYDLSKHGTEYYIAMEFIPGITVGAVLQKLIRIKEKPPWELATYIVTQVLAGLAYAHELRSPDGELIQILHRDITPQNILVTKDGWVKITDFGIAKARNEISSTGTGVIKGKFGYIAPEQLEGTNNADQRADIFAAGILLWETLACRRLFKGQDEIQTIRLVAEAKIPSLSNYRDDVPPGIEQTMLKALAKDPDQRFSSAREFLDALKKNIFPDAVDDFAALTIRYFTSRPEMFASVQRIVGAAKEAEPPAVEDDDDLQEITQLTTGNVHVDVTPTEPVLPKPASRAPWAVVALLLVGLAGAGFVFKDRLMAVVNPTAQLPKLTKLDVQAAVDAETIRLVACYANANAAVGSVKELGARISIAGDGRVLDVELSQEDAQLGIAAACLRDVLRSIRVRTHGDPVFAAYVPLPPPSQHIAQVIDPAPAAEPTPTKIRTREVRRKRRGKQVTRGADVEPTQGSTEVADAEKPTEVPVEEAPAPKLLNSAEVQAVVKQQLTAVKKCMGALVGKTGVPVRIVVEVKIATSGKVDNVSFEPSVGVPEVEDCMRKTFGKMKTRPQPVDGFSVSFPLNLKVK